jgi:hypothetical protein
MLERIELVLEAIRASKQRALAASKLGDFTAYKTAMEDVVYLETTLVGEAEMLVAEIKKAA